MGYLVVGIVAAVVFYRRSTEGLDEIDAPVGNIATMLVCVLWPLALLVMLVRRYISK